MLGRGNLMTLLANILEFRTVSRPFVRRSARHNRAAYDNKHSIASITAQFQQKHKIQVIHHLPNTYPAVQFACAR
jgi:hypothetical protein